MNMLDDLIGRYLIQQYEDVVAFYDSFETPFYLPFEGFGSIWMSGSNNDFMVIDKDVILFKKDSHDFLQGIYRLDISFLKSNFFTSGIQSGVILYKDFELELTTEIKKYVHQEETELVFAPSRKIDQIKRISFYLSDNGVKYKNEEYASLDEVLRGEKVAKLIDARMRKIIEEKQRKKEDK